MNKYHFDIKINDRGNNAGTKATDDCKKILLQNGYKNIEVSFIKLVFLLPFNFVKLFSVLIFYFFFIPYKSLIFVQYPLKGINKFFKYFIRLMKIKGCKFSCIIHDLDSLRSAYSEIKIRNEINALSAYDAVISHNDAMSKWLIDHGFKKHIEEIILFDYLVEDDKQQKNIRAFDDQNITLAFAGNLNKTNFINSLSNANLSIKVNLYGPLSNKLSATNDKIKWLESYSSEQIVQELDGDFGLVWDGDSIKDLSGLMGNYIKYNAPHKTSLYLVAGLPVITSKHAAMADFIINNKIGFCVKSISDLSNEIKNITDNDYKEMKRNVEEIAERLKNGFFFSCVISNVGNYLYR